MLDIVENREADYLEHFGRNQIIWCHLHFRRQ